MKHLDAARFTQQAGGSPALMVRVAQAFLSQLPQWRADFATATQRKDGVGLLLHKMKGSCYAISAAQAAETFSQAEQALRAAEPNAQAQWQNLLDLIGEIETELLGLIEQYGGQIPVGTIRP